jgi:hypothetical protein
MDKPNNSHECSYGGYKLSCIVPDIEHTANVVQVYMGCDDDDTFYTESGKSGRVQIGIELDDGQMAQIDLEDVLRFARAHCTGIYERVMYRVKPLR